MTVVDEAAPSPLTATPVPNVAGAVESTDTVASHLHPAGSWSVEDHPVPHGLEEVWRFTPLKRLRKLHADAPLGAGSVTVEASDHDDLSIRTVTGDEPVPGGGCPATCRSTGPVLGSSPRPTPA